jgi:folate-dependent phosphoribosylglycinamide formyltransferase PurN
MKNIVILISGGGSNMRALVDAARREAWAERHGARIAAVISNRADAAGLAWAAGQGLATAVLSHRTSPAAKPSTPSSRSGRRAPARPGAAGGLHAHPHRASWPATRVG